MGGTLTGLTARRPAKASFNGPGNGTAQAGRDVLINFNNDIELLRRGKGHGFEDPAINEAAEQDNVGFDIGRQRIVRLGQLHLEDTP